MGKVYDAMSKVEEEQERMAHPLNKADHMTKANGRPAQPDTEARERFDFLSYSLNLSPAYEATGASPQREVLQQPIREIELNLGRLDPHLVTLGDCDPAAAEAHHRLASALISAAIERPLKRVLVASALHGDGRTCLTLTLAGALALARRRVLVVDTDLLRPSMLRLLGIDTEIGLAEALSGGAHPADAVIKLMPCGLHVLPTRGLVENAAELLASPEFGRLLESLDHEYDFMLFDSAPLLAAGDTHLLLHHVDTALLVVSPGRCTASQAEQAASLLAPEDVFGVVLNKVIV